MESINKITDNQIYLPESEPADDLEIELRSPVQRALALAQQLKDTVTIVLMLANGMLIFGAIFGIAIPGLVLYALRWKLVRRAGGKGVGIWVLSLLHELAWAVIFLADHPHQSDTAIGHYEGGYALGVLICGLALINLGQNRQDEPTAYDNEA